MGPCVALGKLSRLPVGHMGHKRPKMLPGQKKERDAEWERRKVGSFRIIES